MKTIIAGSRTIEDYELLSKIIKESNFKIDLIVSGGAKGVDELGERYAREHAIPLKLFPADWDKYGKSAGMIRNQQMVDYADSLIAIWDGKSKGTAHTINQAKKKGLQLKIHLIK